MMLIVPAPRVGRSGRAPISESSLGVQSLLRRRNSHVRLRFSVTVDKRARLPHMALTLLPLTGPRVISRGRSLVAVVRSPHRHVPQRRLRSLVRAMAQHTDYDIFVIGKNHFTLV